MACGEYKPSPETVRAMEERANEIFERVERAYQRCWFIPFDGDDGPVYVNPAQVFAVVELRGGQRTYLLGPGSSCSPRGDYRRQGVTVKGSAAEVAAKLDKALHEQRAVVY